jgi:diguanylate cyclase (GGDEF)-like protein
MLLPDARNLVAIGLHASGTTAAVLVCEMPPGQGRIERRLLSMVERFAAHAALALDKARLVERLDRLATTDGLTELATRRSFDAQLARELALSDRSGEPLSMLLLDIDHFKRINDEHGHPVGDIVLRAVASALKAEIGERGLVARYGGEEFAVLLSGVTREAASEISERLRQVVRQLTLDVAVSVSVGAATYPTSADGAYGLVHACDEALYASKRGGRDRVTVAPLTATPMLPSQTRVPGS